MRSRIIADSTYDSRLILTYNGFMKQAPVAGFNTIKYPPVFWTNEGASTAVDMCIQDIVQGQITYEIWKPNGATNLIIASGTYPIVVPPLELSMYANPCSLRLFKDGTYVDDYPNFALAVRATIEPPPLTTISCSRRGSGNYRLQWTYPSDMPADTRVVIVGMAEGVPSIVNNPPANYMTFWEPVVSDMYGYNKVMYRLQGMQYDDNYFRPVVYDGLVSNGSVQLSAYRAKFTFIAYTYRDNNVYNNDYDGYEGVRTTSRIFTNSPTSTGLVQIM